MNWEILLKALGLLGIPAYAIIALLQVRIWQRDTLFIFAGVLVTLRIIGYARRLYHTWRMDNLKYRKEKRQQKYDDEIFS